jgi:hypothetical protein
MEPVWEPIVQEKLLFSPCLNGTLLLTSTMMMANALSTPLTCHGDAYIFTHLAESSANVVRQVKGNVKYLAEANNYATYAHHVISVSHATAPLARHIESNHEWYMLESEESRAPLSLNTLDGTDGFFFNPLSNR